MKQQGKDLINTGTKRYEVQYTHGHMGIQGPIVHNYKAMNFKDEQSSDEENGLLSVKPII